MRSGKRIANRLPSFLDKSDRMFNHGCVAGVFWHGRAVTSVGVAATQFSLVLLGRFPGKDRIVAATLAREFAHDDAWGMQVVGAAPIVVLDGLTAEQAQAIHAALADVEAAGSRFEVQPGVDASLPKLGWPTPAKIKGRTVPEYGAAGAAPAAGPAGAPAGATANFVMPCPYTGQRLRISVTINVTRMDQAPAAKPPGSGPVPVPMPGPQVAAPVPIPVPMPGVPAPRQSAPASVPVAAYRPVPTPIGAPAVLAQGRPPRQATPIRPPAPMAPQALASAPMRKLTPGAGNEEPLIIGLDALDELQPMGAEAAPKAAAPAPRPPVAMPSGAPRPSGGIPLRAAAPLSAPLPDVPIVGNAPAGGAGAGGAVMDAGAGAMPLPTNLMGSPMDLSQFEANVTASGILQAAPLGSADNAAVPADGGLCTVSIGKTANPKVHQLVADLQGIPMAEAAKLCQKPFVTIAKDVTAAEAQNLKQQFAAVNTNVRINARRP
jgi:ribosomal protein L7/L12